jgi:hypothetical protein
MDFKVMKILRASRVEKWIRAVKEFLDAIPIKCVGMDSEFTNPREGRHNKGQHVARSMFRVSPFSLIYKPRSPILLGLPWPVENKVL